MCPVKFFSLICNMKTGCQEDWGDLNTMYGIWQAFSNGIGYYIYYILLNRESTACAFMKRIFWLQTNLGELFPSIFLPPTPVSNHSLFYFWREHLSSYSKHFFAFTPTETETFKWFHKLRLSNIRKLLLYNLKYLYKLISRNPKFKVTIEIWLK